VQALRSADTFAKIETAAAHQLPGHARRLYALLADKKRLGKPEWTFELDQLRALMGVADKKTYLRWASFRDWVITPAVAGINDYGTVTVTMEPVKRGRAVYAVKFSWVWKSLDEAHVTLEENERPHIARRKEAPATPSAPPLMEAEACDPVVREGMARLLDGLGNKLRVPDDTPPEGATSI
jgi:plasmid replication initiation protein